MFDILVTSTAVDARAIVWGMQNILKKLRSITQKARQSTLG
jgi:hypothetical protein